MIITMKRFIGISSSVSFFLLSARAAFATHIGGAVHTSTPISLDPCANQADGPFKNLCQLTNPGQLIGNLIVFIFVISALIALIYLIWGGIKWITSGGDKSGVEGARNHIIAAIVGLIVVFLSFFILNLILGFFGLSLTNLRLPTLF